MSDYSHTNLYLKMGNSISLNSIQSAKFICENRNLALPLFLSDACRYFLLLSLVPIEFVHQPTTYKKPFIWSVRFGQVSLWHCTVREARKENIFLSTREISDVPRGYWPFSLVCFQTVTQGLSGQAGRKCGISQIDYEHGKFCSSA